MRIYATVEIYQPARHFLAQSLVLVGRVLLETLCKRVKDSIASALARRGLVRVRSQARRVQLGLVA